MLATLLVACATSGSAAWDPRLRGDAVVLLGEVHDNANQHALRLATLQRAFAAGWRPAIAMEQFDVDRQADIDRARRERPGDAAYLIALAAPSRGEGGWNWDLYRPFVELALRYDLPLIAANLSNADTSKIVRGGYDAVFDAAKIAALGLDRDGRGRPAIGPGARDRRRPLPRAAAGDVAAHGARPARPRRRHGRRAAPRRRRGGVVLLAGNGHVRRDIGVPRWLGSVNDRVFAVGYLEIDDETTPVAAFDAVVRTAAAERADPCAGFEARQPREFYRAR